MGGDIKIKIFLIIFLLLTSLSTGRSFADIYKCVSDDGVATFSDTPCSNKPELFLNIKNLSIDDAIDLANPLTEFDVDSKTIDEDLLSHAKKLGKSILPDEQYTSYIMDGGGRGSVYRYPEWNISVLYGPPENPTKWKLIIQYRVGSKDGALHVYLKTIYTFLRRNYFDPPAMETSKKMNRVRIGHWKVQ